MTRKPTTALLAVLVVLAVAAAGCGGSDSGSSAKTTTIAQGGANGSDPSTGKVQGGTARFNLTSDTDFVDPALAYYQTSWQFEYATCAKLLNYPDKAGAAGSQLVPEVAQGLPKVSAD